MKRLRQLRWHPALPMALALGLVVPAFYESLQGHRAALVAGLHLSAALLLWLQAWPRRRHFASRRLRSSMKGFDLGLGAATLLCAWLPASHDSQLALFWRLLVDVLILGRALAMGREVLRQAGLARLLLMAAGVVGLCGVGFYSLDPEIDSLSEGLWLAFSTAATVGYGDVVPSTPASRLFSVFVVLLGYGVLSLVTARIAAMFVDTQERQHEREILRDLHAQMGKLQQELASLRTLMLAPTPGAVTSTAPGGATPSATADARAPESSDPGPGRA